MAISLWRETAEAEFLFGPEIPEFIDKVAKSINELWGLGDQEAAIMAGDTAKMDRIRQLLEWLVDEALAEARRKFGSYLNIAGSGAQGASAAHA